MIRCSIRWAIAVLFAAVVSLPAGAQTVALTETFDAAAAPALPEGWTATGVGWKTDAASPSNGSGGGNLAHVGSAAGHVVTPAVDLSGVTAATLTYLARRTSSYDISALVVTASTDGGASFPFTVLAAGHALPSATGSYRPVTGTLPPEVLGAATVVLRFEGAGGSSSSSNARLDDVAITAEHGTFKLSATTLALTAAAGERAAEEVVLTNVAAQPVTIGAPALTGAAFSVSPAGTVTLPSGEAQAYTVTFAPASDGTHAGTLRFSDGAGYERTVSLSGATGACLLGFEAASGTALEGATGVEVTLALSHTNAVPLQAVQFSVTWDSDLLTLTDILRGDAVADAAAWSLTHTASARRADVVLLASGTGGLAAGEHAPLLILQFATGTVTPSAARSVTLALADAVGALAVPEGTDAGVAVSTGTYGLSVERRMAVFTPSTTAIDFGTVSSGASATRLLSVSNPGGTQPLTIHEIAASPLYAVTPTTASVPADGQVTFTVSFTPTVTAFGRRPGTLTFSHDGEGGSSTVAADGVGVRGRGDPGGDGLVDAADVVQLVDLVLSRTAPDAETRTSADLFPFPVGDAALDVRDLTVLAQAVARGRWPDAVTLPEEPEAGGDKTGAPSEAVRLHAVRAEGGWRFELEHAVPIRAFQATLEAPGVRAAPVLLRDTTRAVAQLALGWHDERLAVVRLLLARTDGAELAPGRYPLALVPVPETGPAPGLRYATAVTGRQTRLPVALVPGPEAPGLPRVPGFRLDAPYPNPLRAGETVRIPLELPEAAVVRAALFDLRGRRVAHHVETALDAGYRVLSWDPGPLAAGLYLLRVEVGANREARAIVVIR